MAGITPKFTEVWSDEDLMVIEKPAGLVVHPAPSHEGETLVDQLEGIGRGGESNRPGIVHRLDKETSGLLVVALSEPGFEGLSRQISARQVDRRYLALVSGSLASETGTISAPTGRSRRERTKMAVGGVSSKEAVTHFEVVERLPATTLVEVSLETGRTHQIRVHFAAIGFPLIGDPKYGKGEELGLGRQFLHAAELAFDHPRTGRAMEFHSDLPADLTQALDRARS